VAEVSGTEFATGELLPDTTYFWRVDVVTETGGGITGHLWKFHTGASAPIVK
jgi:ribulose 1,5-bisphosphate carboxylase large subunit-like protein